MDQTVSHLAAARERRVLPERIATGVAAEESPAKVGKPQPALAVLERAVDIQRRDGEAGDRCLVDPAEDPRFGSQTAEPGISTDPEIARPVREERLNPLIAQTPFRVGCLCV